MSRMMQSPVFVIILSLCVSVEMIEASPYERRLYDDLLLDYNPAIRPVKNIEDDLEVKVDVALNFILDLDRQTNALNTIVWMTLAWTDMSLRWNPDYYGNSTKMILRADQVWTPDITIMNLVRPWEILSPDDVIVSDEGSVLWTRSARIYTSCMVDPKETKQSCVLKLASWNHDGSEVNLRSRGGGLDLSNYVANNKWEITNVNVSRNEIFYECCSAPYFDLSYYIDLSPTS